MSFTNPSSIRKQSSETYTVEIKFDRKMGSGDSITAATVIAYDSDDNDVTSEIIAGSEFSGQSVNVGVKGGTDGETYKITTEITTDAQNPDETYEEYESDTNLVISNT